MTVQEFAEKLKALCEEAKVDLVPVQNIQLQVILRPDHPEYVKPSSSSDASQSVTSAAPVADGQPTAETPVEAQPETSPSVEQSQSTGVDNTSASGSGSGEASPA